MNNYSTMLHNVYDKYINVQQVPIDSVTTVYRCSILKGLMLYIQIHISTGRML